jgi:peroxiredoxin
VAASADRFATQERFRDELGAEFSFVADSELSLVRLFGVKMLLLSMAKRVTFVIGKNREILWTGSGRKALDPSGAIAALARY